MAWFWVLFLLLAFSNDELLCYVVDVIFSYTAILRFAFLDLQEPTLSMFMITGPVLTLFYRYIDFYFFGFYHQNGRCC